MNRDFILKGIPRCFTLNEVHNEINIELTNNNTFKDNTSHQFGEFPPNKKPTDKSNMFIIEIKGDFSLENLLATKNLLGFRISFEKRRPSKKPLQCHNCLQMGHVSFNCNRSYVCVKCGTNHPYGKCAINTKIDSSNQLKISV